MAQAWQAFGPGTGWPAGTLAFFAIQLVLVFALLPLWLRWLERRRLGAMRRSLAKAAFAAHVAGTDAAGALAWYLFEDGPPLARLQGVRAAIETHRAARERFTQGLAIHSGAMTGALAEVAKGTIGFADTVADTLARVTRLYLKEASLTLASNVVHGEDALGFAPHQIVAMEWLAELEAAVERFAVAEAENRARVTGALSRRERRARTEAIGEAAEHAAILVAAVRRLLAGLHGADPESTSYRNRKQGERSARTLEGLIARFDRGGATG